MFNLFTISEKNERHADGVQAWELWEFPRLNVWKLVAINNTTIISTNISGTVQDSVLASQDIKIALCGRWIQGKVNLMSKSTL